MTSANFRKKSIGSAPTRKTSRPPVLGEAGKLIEASSAWLIPKPSGPRHHPKIAVFTRAEGANISAG